MRHPKFIQSALMATMLFGATATAYGVKANPRPATVVQPDGSHLTLRLNGDESFHYYSTEDGYAVERGTDGFFYYLDADATVSSVRASDISLRQNKEIEFLRTHSVSAAPDALKVSKAQKGPARAQGLMPSTFPTKGEVRGCVILVEYTDLAFTVPNAREEFSNMLNRQDYSNFGGTGSARDWFIDQSSGMFVPTFDVYGPVRLPHPMAYYGENGGNGDDLRAHEMLIDAADILDDEVDFSQYDIDGDGWIDNVFIFYAGYGENLGYGAPAEAVWPHSWDLREVSNIAYMHDGVRLNHYACTNEIDLDDKMDGIGTFVHEFSHVLGLPDLYSTVENSAFTPGAFSVMDYGPYNNNGRTPPNYSAYERYAFDWLTPEQFERTGDYTLENLAESNKAYIIKTERENEYFLLENRQNSGWDAYIPGSGMLVWHIDYNERIFTQNTVNNTPSHQYVDLVEADNRQTTYTQPGDPFPGTSKKTEFGFETTPSLKSWGGKSTGVEISAIAELEPEEENKLSIISMHVEVSNNEDPSGIDAVDAGTDSDAPVTYYNLQGIRVEKPLAGQTVIRRQGNSVRKILVR